MKSLLRSLIGRSATLQRLSYAWGNRKLFSDFFQHDRMLGDEVRVEAYQAGIE